MNPKRNLPLKIKIQKKFSPILQPIFIVLVSASLLHFSWGERPQQKDLKFGSFAVDETLLKATKKWDGGIIDVPLFKSQQTYVQILYHKKPILGGPGLDSVRPQSHRQYVGRNSFLKMLFKASVF